MMARIYVKNDLNGLSSNFYKGITNNYSLEKEEISYPNDKDKTITKKSEFLECARINFFIGQNNSGKSRFLRALISSPLLAWYEGDKGNICFAGNESGDYPRGLNKPEGRIDVVDKVYIPILRGLRPIVIEENKDSDRNEDFPYVNRTKKDYFNQMIQIEKKSLLDKSPVPYEDKFANLKAFLGYMYAHPGKKLAFMGIDIAQFIEWDEERELDWLLMLYPKHVFTHRYVKELNKYYKTKPALWENDSDWDGFRWHVVDDNNNNVFAFSRKDRSGKEVLVISNFSNQVLKNYEIGVDTWGSYKIVLNSDAKKYDGIAVSNRNLKTINKEKNEFKYTLSLNIPPYATMYIEKK